jgi:ElaB/YqjD/DUF883 family membrane-anchored ribosome-binding protein
MTGPSSDEAKVADLRADIAQTRENLGETVEALAAKADVKARAQDKVDEVKARAQEQVEQVRDKAQGLVHELRTEPAVPARRAAFGVRDSVRAHPKEWAVAAAALAAFILLVARRRNRA